MKRNVGTAQGTYLATISQGSIFPIRVSGHLVWHAHTEIKTLTICELSRTAVICLCNMFSGATERARRRMVCVREHKACCVSGQLRAEKPQQPRETRKRTERTLARLTRSKKKKNAHQRDRRMQTARDAPQKKHADV